jgi:Recombination endonuclease VII
VKERDTAPRSGRGTWWICTCECGETHTVERSNLFNGKTTHCGCSPANRRTRTQCKYGHLYTDDNVYNNPSGSRGCRACARVSRNRWKKKNRPRLREIEKNASLKTNYGITLDDYNQMLLNQDGLCAICKNPPSGKQPWLHVDHCHKTEQVRKLLCFSCNIGLGSFKDSPHNLKAAAAYLEEFCTENV